jgi:hypothetical protein
MTTRNISESKRPIEFQMSSSFLVLIDPLVLDGISSELQKLLLPQVAANPQLIRALPGPMKVGLHCVDDFFPGTYCISNDDLENADSNHEDVGVFEIDTGTLILADLGYLPRLAQILTWERYDRALQSPAGDDSSRLRFAEELGGPFFGILWGDINTPFQGDGAYKIKRGVPRRAITPST